MACNELLESIRSSHSIDYFPEGLVLPVDKPYRWTSADVIRKIKWTAGKHFGKKNLKVGHAGTLDPMATGLLVVFVGRATRAVPFAENAKKKYTKERKRKRNN
mgnify:CR=1 FL=1